MPDFFATAVADAVRMASAHPMQSCPQSSRCLKYIVRALGQLLHCNCHSIRIFAVTGIRTMVIALFNKEMENSFQRHP